VQHIKMECTVHSSSVEIDEDNPPRYIREKLRADIEIHCDKIRELQKAECKTTNRAVAEQFRGLIERETNALRRKEKRLGIGSKRRKKNEANYVKHESDEPTRYRRRSLLNAATIRRHSQTASPPKAPTGPGPVRSTETVTPKEVLSRFEQRFPRLFAEKDKHTPEPVKKVREEVRLPTVGNGKNKGFYELRETFETSLNRTYFGKDDMESTATLSSPAKKQPPSKESPSAAGIADHANSDGDSDDDYWTDDDDDDSGKNVTTVKNARQRREARELEHKQQQTAAAAKEYLQSCQRMQLLAEPLALADRAHESVLDLSHYSLSQAKLDSLQPAFKHLPKARVLNLKGNRLHDGHLIGGRASNTGGSKEQQQRLRRQEGVVSDCEGSDEESGKTAHISGKRTEGGALCKLFQAVGEDVETLILDDNCIGVHGVRSLCEVFRRPECMLASLTMSRQGAQGASGTGSSGGASSRGLSAQAVELLCEGLAALNHGRGQLKALDLSENLLTMAGGGGGGGGEDGGGASGGGLGGIARLVAGGGGRRLTSLNLRGCGLRGGAASAALFQGLLQCAKKGVGIVQLDLVSVPPLPRYVYTAKYIVLLLLPLLTCSRPDAAV
jgi:hypothetical protein